MRAAVVNEAAGAFELEELQTPRPGPGEVLVKVAACGVCHSDLHVRGGGIPFPMPCVLGHEISGEVIDVGSESGNIQIGDKVVGAFIMPCRSCRFCRAGREELCERFFAENRLNGTLYDGKTRLYRPDGEPLAMYSMGGLAEYSVMPVGGVAKLPDGLPLVESAVLGCAFLTACGAVRNAGQPEDGESVAVIGAGGVGLALVQVLSAFGCSSITVVDISDEKLEVADRLGAHHLVNGADTDAVAAVREASPGGFGVDLAFEVVGDPRTFRQATEMVTDGGRCCFVGLAAAGVEAAVEINRLVRRRITLIGSFGGKPRRDLPTAVALASSGKIRLADAVSRTYSLDQVDDAYLALERGEILGRAVIDMAGGRN